MSSNICTAALLVFISTGLSAQTQLGLDIDGQSQYQLGTAVSMPDRHTLAIGAPNANDSGSALVYRWDGADWVQKGQELKAEGLTDFFGRAISMADSNTVAVGALGNGGNGLNSGDVRVFRWDGAQWIQKGMDIDGEAQYDQSGWSVSMGDSNTVCIGATQNSGGFQYSGHVRVYTWDGKAWVQKGNDIDAIGASDLLGFAVSMPDANTLAAGAPYNDDLAVNAGHVRIFR